MYKRQLLGGRSNWRGSAVAAVALAADLPVASGGRGDLLAGLGALLGAYAAPAQRVLRNGVAERGRQENRTVAAWATVIADSHC